MHMRKVLALSLIMGLACDESGLAGSPHISLEVQDGGNSLLIQWYSVVGADKYQLLVDSQVVYEGTDTSYTLNQPCRLIECRAIGGNETSVDQEDLSAITDSVELWERDGEGVAAIGFTGTGAYTTYALSDTDSAHRAGFRFYLDDFRPDTIVLDSIRMVSSDFNGFGDPFNDCKALFAMWQDDSIPAPDTASYQDKYSEILLADSVYAVWLDVDANGWEEGHESDHFMKIKVLAAPDSTGKVVFRYWFQKVAGLRWVPVAPEEEN